MTAYTRQPKKVIVRCPVCPWVNVFWESDRRRVSPQVRAEMALNAHGRAKHRDKLMQSLRPLMR